MTLAKGNHVVKLDLEGNPLTTDRETYIEYEVEELTPNFSHLRFVPEGGEPWKETGHVEDGAYVLALLRKVK